MVSYKSVFWKTKVDECASGRMSDASRIYPDVALYAENGAGSLRVRHGSG
ncbi:MAG: hypothetical protein R3A46_21530 [Thermomicrobiales bacterium]